MHSHSTPHTDSSIGCEQCRKRVNLEFSFTMAFQPIVDCKTQSIFGYEALVRGMNNESAWSVISQVDDSNRYAFDQACRVKAIELASKLKLNKMLSINFLPNAVYQPERCIKTTLEAARKYNFPIENIIFEFTEVEQVERSEHLKNIVEYYKEQGFTTAIDDFGAGFSGLNLLCDFQPNIVKLDMHLIRGIDQDPVRQTILRSCLSMFEGLGINTLAEGVETKGEMLFLKEMGIALMQGYYFAKPAFEALPDVDFNSL